MAPNGTITLPAAASADTNRVLYVFEGSVSIDGDDVAESTGVVVVADRAAPLRAGDAGAEILVLQGRPIGEPVAQYGPFVMNTRAEIDQAFADYRRTGFGGWPWDRPDPVHGGNAERFARHADGRDEQPVARRSGAELSLSPRSGSATANARSTHAVAVETHDRDADFVRNPCDPKQGFPRSRRCESRAS